MQSIQLFRILSMVRVPVTICLLFLLVTGNLHADTVQQPPDPQSLSDLDNDLDSIMNEITSPASKSK